MPLLILFTLTLVTGLTSGIRDATPDTLLYPVRSKIVHIIKQDTTVPVVVPVETRTPVLPAYQKPVTPVPTPIKPETVKSATPETYTTKKSPTLRVSSGDDEMDDDD